MPMTTMITTAVRPGLRMTTMPSTSTSAPRMMLAVRAEAFAPFVALYLTEHLGLWSAGAYLLSGALCTLAALTLFKRTQDARRSEDSSWR